MKRILFFLLLVLSFVPLCAQQHSFIRYHDNRLDYADRSASLDRFFERWQRMVATGQGNINIVHIGGSHVQAGTLSNAIRQRLLYDNPTLVADRGMLFPYSAAARCNNPADYRVRCPQKVSLTRNVYKEYPNPLGLCGISVTAADSTTEVAIALRDSTIDYATSSIVVLGHSDQNVIPHLLIGPRTVFPSYIDPRTDRFIFNLVRPTDSFTVVLPCRKGQQFALTGIYLANRRPGFSFHSIGVNGAAVPDFLRCQHFTRDLRLLHPDLVVFGIGINDASKSDFDTAEFRHNYLALVDSIRSVNPDCAFIFISNNDSFRKLGRRKYQVNRNGLLARDVFRRLALDTDGALWDQFHIMGGLSSMERWQRAKLAQADRVHFTRAGYLLLGDLFYEALAEAYRKHKHR